MCQLWTSCELIIVCYNKYNLMDYFYSLQDVLLQYGIVSSDFLTVEYYMFNLACSLCLSSVPSMDDDAVISVSSFREMTKTTKISLRHWPLAPCRSICLHSNQPHHLPHHSCTLWRLSSAHPLAFYHSLHIICALPASSTSMLVWTRSHHYVDFQHLCHVLAMY